MVGVDGAHLLARSLAWAHGQRMRELVPEYPAPGSQDEAYRKIELESRRQFMEAQHVVSTGAYMLTGGLVVAVAGLLTALGLCGKLPVPGQAVDERKADARNAALGRWATDTPGLALRAPRSHLYFHPFVGAARGPARPDTEAGRAHPQ